jgi:hypothetical protein
MGAADEIAFKLGHYAFVHWHTLLKQTKQRKHENRIVSDMIQLSP